MPPIFSEPSVIKNKQDGTVVAIDMRSELFNSRVLLLEESTTSSATR